jgi:hypothetical protein
MKPCPKYREQIAWLAIDALEIQHEPELRAHLDICAGCRCYLEEISSVAGRLRAAEPQSGSQPSASFHRGVVGALAMAERRLAGGTLVAQVWSLWNWRLALSAGTAVALVIAAWLVAAPRADVPMPTPLNKRAIVTPGLKAELEPTFSNYEMVAHQSLDKLDELLTEQGGRNQAPSPIYTTRPMHPPLNSAD